MSRPDWDVVQDHDDGRETREAQKESQVASDTADEVAWCHGKAVGVLKHFSSGEVGIDGSLVVVLIIQVMAQFVEALGGDGVVISATRCWKSQNINDPIEKDEGDLPGQWLELNESAWTRYST